MVLMALTNAYPSTYENRKLKIKTKGKPTYGAGYDKGVYGSYETHPVIVIKFEFLSKNNYNSLFYSRGNIKIRKVPRELNGELNEH